MQRNSKRAIIAFIYIGVLLLFFVGVFFAFFYEQATCTDGKQNQDETGIDCGGRCSEYCLADLASQPLLIEETELLPYTATSSDAISTVTNKNTRAALKSAKFTFTVYDQSDSIVDQESGTFSLLPLESHTLSVFGLPVNKNAGARVEFTVTNEEWVALTDFTEAPDIRIVNQQFSLLSGEAGFAEARGLVQNRSPYDTRTLTVIVIPRDATGKALSVNKTTLNTVLSGEERDFRLLWPQSFTGTVARTDMQLHFDFLADDAFVKQYFPGGKFQSITPGE